MVLLRKLNNADPGTGTTLGDNDTNKLSDYFNDVDVSEVPRINTPTEFRNGILKIRDSTNTYNISLKSAAQTANRDFTIPALTGNDSFALLGIPQSFTDIQTITKDAADILKLYRPANTTNNLVGLEFDHRNSSNTQTAFGKIETKLVNNVAGDEDGTLVFSVMKDGVMTQVATLDKNSLLTVSSVALTTYPRILLNSGAPTTIVSTTDETDMLNYTLPANTLGANGSIRVRLSGYILQNDASSRAFQVKVKFGGTSIFDSTTQSMAQDAENRPFILEFTLRNANATNSQWGTGWMACGLADVTPTVGIGDINDDEVQVFSPFGFGTSSKDTTADQVLAVTMTQAFSSAAVKTVVNGKDIMYMPGVPTP